MDVSTDLFVNEKKKNDFEAFSLLYKKKIVFLHLVNNVVSKNTM